MRWQSIGAATIAAAATLGIGAMLHAQQPSAQAGGGAQERVAALKQNLQQGMALARKYEWTETTIIKLKGEEKGRKQNRCYYGADGKVQKTSLDQPAQQAQDQGGGGGRRGGRLKQRVVENKKGEMKDYMEKAAALIHRYVPPNPQQIQAAKEGGRIVVNPLGAGKVRLVISQYLLPGDSMSIDLDGATNRLLGLGVNTYLDKPEDAVTLAVQMVSLPDGALYAGQTTFDAKAKNITVVIQNSGYRPLAQ